MKLILNHKFLFFLILYLFLFLLTGRNPLIWDTVQFASDQPSWYYDNNFRYFLLPDYCDSGHPPTFALYLATVWKVFGRSLFVNHLAMQPFIAMIIYQVTKLGDHLFPGNKKHAFLLALLVLTQAGLISQCSLVSPDILVIAFFLYTINAILSRSALHTLIACTLLGLCSMRTMMCSMALFLFALSYNAAAAGKSWKGMLTYVVQQILPFVPGGIIAVIYFSYHYYAKGWIGLNPDGPWAGGYQHWAGVVGFLRNVVVIGWRLVDLGNIGTVTVAVILMVQWMRGKLIFKTLYDRNLAYKLLVLCLSLLLLVVLPLCLYSSLLVHRYILPFVVGIFLLSGYLLLQSSWKNKYWVLFFMILIQISGHFWTYPRRFSQGWDSTLSHLNLFPLRKSFKEFMAQKGIEKKDVATAFTLIQSDNRIDLKGDTTDYKDFETDSTRYVWYTNVSNTMNSRVNYYFTNWRILKYEKRGNVEMALFEKK